MKMYFGDGAVEVEDTINVVCPHCKKDVEISDYLTIYHINRLGESLAECTLCESRFLIFYDGNGIKTLKKGKTKNKNLTV